MFAFIGYLVVISSVLGGYAMAGGHLAALMQPLELLMILGAAVGAFMIGNRPNVIKATLKGIPLVFKKNPYNKAFFSDLISVLFLLMLKIKKQGMMTIESDIDNPGQSEIFNNYPRILKNHHLMDFICDYLRLMVAGTADFFQMENLMDNEISIHHHEEEIPAHALTRIADGMPAFGIVAAVMGVVHTMESLGGPPNELGVLVAHALVGTFLGIWMGYGFITPLAVSLEHRASCSIKAFECVKVALLATINNYSPNIAIEFTRKSLFSGEKPSNSQLEELLKELKSKSKGS
jgi:chemotaxis protein MotA